MKSKKTPLRVLVVDDSIVVRALLREMLESDPEIIVVGEAANGAEAVELTQILSPDLITLDVRMPVMDGLDAVSRIMSVKPTPILIVTASLSKDELDISFDAIHRGALDVMLKPLIESRSEYSKIQKILIDKVKLLSRIRVIQHIRRPRKTRRFPSNKAEPRNLALVIGASTGGPAAVMTILKSLTRNFPIPIVVVQHIAQGFAEGFTAWLDRNLPFDVKLAEDGSRLAVGRVLIAPDGYHTVLEPGKVRLRDDPPMNSCKPSADALFFSAAEVYRENTIAVVLTGMGNDGARGARAVKDRGGHVIVQDEESCVVFGMPQAAIQAHAESEVLPLNEIADALVCQVLRR